MPEIAPSEGSPVCFEEAPALRLVGKQREYAFDEMGQIPALWAEFAPSLEEGMVAYGIVRSLPNGKGIEYAAAAEGVEEKEGLVLLRIPAQRYAVFVHEGRVSTLCETIDHAFQSWLPQSGYVHAGGVDLLERYGPEFDPTHGEGDLQVWIPVRDPEG